jgi:hypothetical protein
MALLVLYLVCAIVAGGLAMWRSPRMPRSWPLLVIAALPQGAALLGIRMPGLFLISVAAIGVWCLRNYAIIGVPMMSLGIALNLLVMGLYGGAMPIQVHTMAQIGQPMAVGALPLGSKDIVVQSAYLALLFDWIVLSFSGITIVASPGDVILITGIMWWLLFSYKQEREESMPTLAVTPTPIDNHDVRILPGQSARPALTRLALLAAANPTVAERLLHDPITAATAHPHYVVTLDARDRATLDDIRARAHTVDEFLDNLADVVDGRNA